MSTFKDLYNNEIKKRDFRDRFAVCGNPFFTGGV